MALLTDAVASFTRCRIRDAALVVLSGIVVVTVPAAALAWTTLALIVAACGGGRSVDLRAADPSRRRATLIVGLLALTAQVAVAVVVTAFALYVQASTRREIDWVGLGNTFSLSSRVGEVALGAILVLVLLDVYGTVWLQRAAFGRTTFQPVIELASPWRRLGAGRYHRALERIMLSEGQTEGHADVLISRGEHPFPGSGRPEVHRAIVMTLSREGEPTSPSGAPFQRVLHQAIRDEMVGLRSRGALAPDDRLLHLEDREQVVVPASELLRHLGHRDVEDILPWGTAGPPAQEVPVEVARRGIDKAREWGRYYQHFVIESWERDLVVSVHVTLACDEHYLYLQWVPTVLRPVLPELRTELDDEHRQLRRAHRRAWIELVTLPAGLPARLRRAVRRFRRLRVPAGVCTPEQFGARYSVREMASPQWWGTWLQRVDERRYVVLFDRVILEAVRSALEREGFSLAEFSRLAQTIINNFGDISDSVVAAGVGNVAQGPAGS